MRQALCVRRGGLGDTLLVIPVLRAMRARMPDARLTFAGVSEFGGVLQRFGVVDRVVSSESLALWALPLAEEAGERARAALATYDWIVGDDPGLARRASRTREVAVFDPRLDESVTAPAAEVFLARAGLSGSVEVALVPRREPTPKSAPVLLHAGSGGRAKCWPPSALRELALALAARGPLQVVLGPAELERGEDGGWPEGVAVLRPRTVDALVERIATARAHVGHDAGPTHLAAALGVPTCALFVSTSPAVWAPRGEHVRVLSPSARPADVLAALSRLLDGGTR